ncbi:hypothetical protein O3M35_010969 [Rhynocoris fuscipes]|uniref:Uncharacterized protein n=1 Tax=Rhynocoris fuscipes TaxID=488301 RepID=A0AAW1D811_9HEMI
MSVRISGLYVGSPGAQEKENSQSQQQKPPIAIVTPHRSNSLDILNFEEKRQLIASSLSLTDFLHRGGTATSPSSPTTGSLYGTFFFFKFYLKKKKKKKIKIIKLFFFLNFDFIFLFVLIINNKSK